MNKKQLQYSQLLMALAHCEQSDGYLKKWAREKMAEASGNPSNSREYRDPVRRAGSKSAAP